VDFSRGLLQLLLSSVSHARQLTFAPRTLAPPRKQLSRTPALARVAYGGMYPGRGQMLSSVADDGPALSHARHWILMRYISVVYMQDVVGSVLVRLCTDHF